MTSLIVSTLGPPVAMIGKSLSIALKALIIATVFLPPTNGEIFKEMMERYRIQCSHHEE